MNKKVALATCYFQSNYGSQLQAYATQKILDDWGVENETICIEGLRAEIGKAKYKYFLSMILDPATVKSKLGFVKHSIQLKLKKNTFGKNIAIRNEMFDHFKNEQFRVSAQYNSKKELGKACHIYAAVIVGSDQLWLPSNIEADYYTLNFVPDQVSKISFATSFGVSVIPDAQKDKAASFLRRLNYVSVREKSGQKLIKELTDREATVVCDPTLLFSAQEWMSIQKPERIIEEKYIFCYFLGDNPEHRSFVQRLKATTGYKIVQLQHLDEYIASDERFADFAPYNVGPSEYVSLIRDAEFVCTDSFHGTVFSIIHKKKFFSFRRFKKDSSVSTNSRLYSLLDLLNLEERFLTGNENVECHIKEEIDFENVHDKLDKFKESSKLFLKEALINSGIQI